MSKHSKDSKAAKEKDQAPPSVEPEMTLGRARMLSALPPVDPTMIAMAEGDETALALLRDGQAALKLAFAHITCLDLQIENKRQEIADFSLALQEYANETGGGALVFQNFQLCLNLIRERRKAHV